MDNVSPMPFRVRTPDGELSYPSLRDVEHAFHQGLVDPDDEVIDEATGATVRAKDHPAFGPPPVRRFWQDQRAQPARVAVVLTLLVSALVAGAVQQMWLALASAAVAAWLLMRVAITAHARPRR